MSCCCYANFSFFFDRDDDRRCDWGLLILSLRVMEGGGFNFRIVVVGVSLKLYYYPLTSLHKHSLTVIYIYPKRKPTDAQDMTTDQLHERDVFPRPSHHDIQSVKFLSYHVHHSLSADVALDPHGRNCFLTHSYQLPGLSLGR